MVEFIAYAGEEATIDTPSRAGRVHVQAFASSPRGMRAMRDELVYVSI